LPYHVDGICCSKSLSLDALTELLIFGTEEERLSLSVA
jgi:hypothetical protein